MDKANRFWGKSLLEQSWAGVLLSFLENPETVQYLQDLEVPVAQCGRVPQPEEPWRFYLDEAGTCNAVGQLMAAKGREKPVYLTLGDENAFYNRYRVAGLRKEYPAISCLTDPQPQVPGGTWEARPSRKSPGQLRRLKDLASKAADGVSQGRWDSIFVANSALVFPVLQALGGRGLSYPSQVGLVCFDVPPLLKTMGLDLTVVTLPYREMYFEAAKSLVSPRSPERNRAFKGRIIEGNSL